MKPVPRYWRTRSERPFDTRYAKALTVILREHGKILQNDRVRICKLSPGRHERSAGAWLWCAYSEQFASYEVVGSIFRLRDILAAPSVSVVTGAGGPEIIPER